MCSFLRGAHGSVSGVPSSSSSMLLLLYHLNLPVTKSLEVRLSSAHTN